MNERLPYVVPELEAAEHWLLQTGVSLPVGTAALNNSLEALEDDLKKVGE